MAFRELSGTSDRNDAQAVLAVTDISTFGGRGDVIRFGIAEDPDGVTVSLEGELDVITLPDVGLALELARTRGAPVSLDCTLLNFVDVAALRFLRRARDRARSTGSDLTLANPHDSVLRLLELTDSLPLVAERTPPAASVPLNPDRAAVLRAAVAVAGQLTGTAKANVQLADPAARQLRIVAQLGFSQQFLEFFGVVADTSSACGTALRTGAPVWVPDVARSPIFSRAAAQVMLDAGSAAVASVPIRTPGGELIAMLSAHHEAPLTWQNVTKYQLERLAGVTGRLIWCHDGQCPATLA